MSRLSECRSNFCFQRSLAITALALVLGGTTFPAVAQEEADILSGLADSANEWAWENLDESVLEVFEEVDRERLEAFFADVKNRLQASSVQDLAGLRAPAKAMLPFLSQFEETAPLAAWLRTRLDYFEVAEALTPDMAPKPSSPSPSSAPPGSAPSPALAPKSIQVAWTKQLEKREVPPEAQPYVRQLKPIFVAEKVPAQLVWLAEVESSFNPKARSPSGARGMFQLMKPTGKRLGLSTFLPDERLNPEKSARAAARHLHELHDRYGDWRLALAAYNAGAGRIDGLLKKSRSKRYEDIAARLPSETQMYVPKMEATLRKREGTSLSEL